MTQGVKIGFVYFDFNSLDCCSFRFNCIKMQSIADHTVDLSELCRICARKGKQLVNLFLTKRKENTMADMLGVCLQNTVHPNDGRPTNICLGCVPKLFNSFELLKVARSSEQYFQRIILSRMCTRKSEVEQFVEPKLSLETSTVQCAEPLIVTDFDGTVPDPLAGNEVKIEKVDANVPTIETQLNSEERIEVSNDAKTVRLCFVKQKRTYQCYICKRTSFTAKRLQTHLKKHDNKKTFKFKCNICGEAYPFKCDLDVHLCEGDSIACEYCPEVRDSLKGILAHLKVHTDLLVYKCIKCTSGFNLNSLLKAHELFHKRLPFACKICGKKFGTRQTQINHTRFVHSDERRKI